MTRFSERSAFDSEPNELARALAARRAAGGRVIDLTESNPTRAGIPYDERAITEALASPASLRYEPQPFGLMSARALIAQHEGVDVERVVLTASTSEAYGFMFKLFCDAGDEVLAPAPSYPLFSQLAALEGVKLAPYRLRYDGAWHIDLESVRAAITPRSRAILVVSPNNPTGSCLKADELEALNALDLPIVSDEVFAEYMFREPPGRVRVAARHAARGLVVSLGGLSKLVGLPQMKLGWMIVGGDAAEALERLSWIADAWLSVGAPVQHALPKLLEAGSASRAAIARRTKRNLASLDRAVAGTTATRLDVEGGWYATLRIPRVRSDMQTCLRALERGAYVHPGAFFDFEDDGHLVLSLLTPDADFDEGVTTVLDAIR